MQTQVRFCLIVPLVCIWPLIANADNSDAATLVSEGGTPDLPQSAVDSCLERVRVLEETEPSAQLQALEASLERRESGRLATARAAAAPAASPRDFAPPPVAAREMPAQDEFASAHLAVPIAEFVFVQWHGTKV